MADTIESLRNKNSLLKTKVEKLAIEKTILRDGVIKISQNTIEDNIKRTCKLILSKTEEI